MARAPPMRQTGRFYSYRPAILSSVKLLFLSLSQISGIKAVPIYLSSLEAKSQGNEGMPADSPTLWIYLVVAIGLVLLGGAFAGLTIALMGQDEIYLQVIEKSGEGKEKAHAAKVLRLLKRGKHWVLVTLLLGNVITNETLPIVLDRSLGGGWPAVLGSTVLIVIFGEIIPQSICVRHGLPIGAWMAPLVFVLMYIMAPVAYPTAKLLDYLLGEDHGTTYKKAGLKTLVTLHKTLGQAGEQLNSDEVTIISSVLDLKEKSVGSIMTPMEDVFTMSADTILDEETMDIILSAGYSRIPIHEPGNVHNFVGMLLVKILITYDPEDAQPVREFALATLPETSPETSCLDIVNFFQEGKSHMVLVSEFPGEDKGALGVVTLEDVIEELIGEEIIDESDVFIDVHKAIRRIAPAPRTRVPKGEIVVDPQDSEAQAEEDLIEIGDEEQQKARHEAVARLAASDGRPQSRNKSSSVLSSSPKAVFLMRRKSSAINENDRDTITKRIDSPEVRDHLKHLGPSNLASRPRSTRFNTVKIKQKTPGEPSFADSEAGSRKISLSNPPSGVRIGELLSTSAGTEAKDGVQALYQGYGTIDHKRTQSSPENVASKGVQANGQSSNSPVPTRRTSLRSTSPLTSLSDNKDQPSRKPSQTRGSARSGSITENIIDSNGIKKVVLETTSGSDDGNTLQASSTDLRQEAAENAGEEGGLKKKRRRKKKKGGASGENKPLLEEDEE